MQTQDVSLPREIRKQFQNWTFHEASEMLPYVRTPVSSASEHEGDLENPKIPGQAF